MLRWIFLEIKQMLLNRKNIMLFIILLLMNVMVFSFLSNDDEILSSQLEYHLMWAEHDERINNDLTKAIAENNMEEYNRINIINMLEKVNRTERYLLNMKKPIEQSLVEKVESYYRNFDLHQDLKERIYQKFGYIDENTDVDPSPSSYNQLVSQLQYRYEVFDKDFMYYDSSTSTDSLTIVVFIFQLYLKYIIILVPLVVGFDAFSKDKKDGSIRTVMALSQKRSQYYFVKVFSTLIVSLIIIFMPLLIVVLGHNINIIKDLDYPTFIYEKGLTSLNAINPFIQSGEGPFGYVVSEFSVHSHSVWSLDEFGITVHLAKGVILSNLATLFGYSFILIVLIILFILSIQLAISVNTNKQLSLIITVVILISLFLFAKSKNLVRIDLGGFDQFIHAPRLIERLNPIVYMNAISTVDGTVPYTFLAGVLNLTTLSVIINSISIYFLNRKDITS